jgi:hypothetical protein
MSNRKADTASKRSRSTKTSARAQRSKQALVKSREENRRRSVAPIEASSANHGNPKHETPKRAEGVSQMTSGRDLMKSFDFPMATSNVQVFQARLLGMTQTNMQFAQANMQFVFEFVQRLATMRSPFEVASVIAEFTGRRLEMFRKYSREMTELTVKRIS